MEMGKTKKVHIYSEYDRQYQAQPKQVKKRIERNRARRWMTKELGKAALKGKDIGHKRSLENGGKTTRGNIKVQSRSSNRADKSHLKYKK